MDDNTPHADIPLFFAQHEADTGGTRWPIEGRLQAFVRPVDDESRVDDEPPRRAGSLEYLLSPRGAVAFIDMIFVERRYRRRGVATALMNELRARHPRLRRYVFGELLPDGQRFFAYYGPWRAR